MPPKKKKKQEEKFPFETNEYQVRVLLVGLKNMSAKPPVSLQPCFPAFPLLVVLRMHHNTRALSDFNSSQINFDDMADQMGMKNPYSAKNSFFKIMKEKLGNDPTKLPAAAPSNLKRGRDQVEEGPVDKLRLKEPPTKRLNKMALNKSIFDHEDPEQEDGGVPLDNTDSQEVPVPSHEVPVPSTETPDVPVTSVETPNGPGPSTELDEHWYRPLDELIDPRMGTEWVAWPGMPDLGPTHEHWKNANFLNNEYNGDNGQDGQDGQDGGDEEVVHLGTRLRLNGPKNPYQQRFDSAQEEFAAPRAQGHGGNVVDDEDCDSDSTHTSYDSDSDGDSDGDSGGD